MKKTYEFTPFCSVIVLVLLCLTVAATCFAQPGESLSAAAKADFGKSSYDSCLKEYSALIAAQPRNDDHYAERSRCHYLKANGLKKSGDVTAESDAAIELALADAEKSLALNPKNTAALVVRGIVKSYKNDENGAITDYSKAIEIDPKLQKAYSNRATEKISLKDFSGAITDLSKLIELNPQFPQIYFTRGTVYGRMRKSTEAIADFSKMIELDPKNSRSYLYRGKEFGSLDRCTEAVGDFTKLLEIDPKFAAPGYTERGVCYYKLGKIKEAVADLTKAIELDPKNQQAANALARLNGTAPTTPTRTTGCVSGNCVNGYGKVVLIGGNIYEGNFVNKAANGKGKLVAADGSVYEGDFVNGKLEGQATLTFKNGEFYIGQYANGLRNGKGKNKYADGNIYEGSWVNNKKEGEGIFTYTSGEVYTGQFANDARNGKGKSIFASGNVYEGDWVNDKFEGQGTFAFKSGEIYSGQFANDLRKGKGKNRYANGDIYEGDWANNKRDGQGIYTAKSGEVYTGRFANGLRNGKGKSRFASGDTYDGDWVDDKFEGQGTYIFKNGNYYTGGFRNDTKTGYGKEYNKATNIVREGTWKDDKFVNSPNAATFITTDQKIAELTKKIAASPKNDDLYVERGEVYYDKLDYKSALADAEKALQINPENQTAQELKEDAESELDSAPSKADEKTSNSKPSGNSTAKPEPQKTAEEWQKIAVVFRVKIEDAVEKKKDDELAIKLYRDFDQTISGGSSQQTIKNIRKHMLRTMYQSRRLKLTEFVLKEMEKLNYDKDEKYEVTRFSVFYV